MGEVSLLFLLDCTGSMSSWIAKVKEDIKNVVDSINNDFSQMNLKINLAFVGYRDWCDGGDRIEKYAFTTNIETFKSNVSKVAAKGGGDLPEDVLGGIQEAINIGFKGDIRVIYHILDAPPHGKTFWSGGGDEFPDGHPSDPKYQDLLKKMQSEQIIYFIAKLNDHLKQFIEVFQKYGESIGFEVKESALSNANEFLKSVVQVVSHAIRVSNKPPSVSDVSEVRNIVKDIDKDSNEFKAYVGIDFGTDGTAFSYAISGSEDVVVDQSWTGKLDIKDRTNILLDSKYRCIAFGYNAYTKYLTMKDKECYYFERFKMALYDDSLRKIEKIEKKFDDIEDEKKEKIDDDDDDGNQREEIIFIKAANGKYVDSEIVFTEALKYVKVQIMNVLEKAASISNVSDVSWILTVPAIWSNHAKYMMQRAACNAQMIRKDVKNHLRIAFEPECASVVVKKTSKYPLKKGDKYILLDLGGGTADIACHEYVSEIDSHQIYRPTGGPWGATYIDMAFIKLLESIFGKTIMEKYYENKPTDWVSIKENFRNAKHSYKNGTQFVRLPNSLLNYIEDCISDGVYDEEGNDYREPCDIVKQFEFDKDDLNEDNKYIQLEDDQLILNHIVWKSLFDIILLPLFEETKNLLQKKELIGCKVIFGVGGAYESKYIQQRIEQEFKKEYAISTVNRPILAVVEGAARFGWCPTLISEFRCDAHYGISVRADFDSSKHEDKMKFFDYSTKKYAIDNVFQVFFEKNALIRMTELPCHVIHFVPANVKSDKIRIALYRSDQDIPPAMVNDKGCQLAGDRWFKLPKDLDFKKDPTVPIIFRFEGTLVKVYVGMKNYPEKEREITLKWKR